jgi:hypothetical protein
MEKDNNKEYNWDEYNEKLHLSDVMFSIFTLDEIKTIIQARQNRSKKLLYLSKIEQNEANEVFKKIQDMFDV